MNDINLPMRKAGKISEFTNLLSSKANKKDILPVDEVLLA